jgi:hypothetical protein
MTRRDNLRNNNHPINPLDPFEVVVVEVNVVVVVVVGSTDGSLTVTLSKQNLL